ncbi:MAG: NADH dehydrogenase, FAD-containing subunit [Halonotius sp. J07HN4]|jgi:NADH dehydrogenase, FAD-containing subunit|nr:MAG: NADH dehydrogenase, FAD-containing subunit [Halonotius sp. J07HN4]
MSASVVVVGAGYAGAGAVKSFEDEIDEGEAELTWISEQDYHLVLHETHRVIRHPEVESKVAIPVDEIKSPDTNFIRDRVTGINAGEQTLEVQDGEPVEYDYLLLAVGSSTAFFGIDGLKEHALTMKSLDDAREIHEAVRTAGEEATKSEPAQVLVGGAGLSGIQIAGEIAGYRDDTRAPIDIKLIEGLDEIFPGNSPEVQGALKKRLLDRDVEIFTGEFISEVDEESVYLGEESMPYDVLVWAGGIAGHEPAASSDLSKDERSNRVHVESNFQTSDDRVFAIGDTALIDQGGDEQAPPTAEAAWTAAEIAGENLARAVRGAPLKSWQHKDKGTAISIGEDAIAHDVIGIPVNTFGGIAAKMLKKAIAARWIAEVSSTKRAISAWSDM